jgi:GxxExxY protein
MEPDFEVDLLAHKVVGAALEVHRELGPGYLESVYQSALAIELGSAGVSFEPQKAFMLGYKRQQIGEGRLDFLVGNQLVVEIKAVETLLPIHKAQVISYLKATKSRVGLLINFNVKMLKNGIQRIIWSEVC